MNDARLVSLVGTSCGSILGHPDIHGDFLSRCDRFDTGSFQCVRYEQPLHDDSNDFRSDQSFDLCNNDRTTGTTILGTTVTLSLALNDLNGVSATNTDNPTVTNFTTAMEVDASFHSDGSVSVECDFRHDSNDEWQYHVGT